VAGTKRWLGIGQAAVNRCRRSRTSAGGRSLGRLRVGRKRGPRCASREPGTLVPRGSPSKKRMPPSTMGRTSVRRKTAGAAPVRPRRRPLSPAAPPRNVSGTVYGRVVPGRAVDEMPSRLSARAGNTENGRPAGQSLCVSAPLSPNDWLSQGSRQPSRRRTIAISAMGAACSARRAPTSVCGPAPRDGSRAGWDDVDRL